VARKPERRAGEAGSDADASEPDGAAPALGPCRAWRDELTLYQDADWCIVDKPAGVGCEPRDPAELDAPADLSERLEHHYARRAPRNVFALPRRASGITLLGWQPDGRERTPPRDAPIAELSAVVAIDGFRLGDRGRLGERSAPLAFTVQARAGQRALLRVELGALADKRSITRALELLARDGLPVVGDHERGGAAATRLMLHVDSARGRWPLAADLPSAFSSWLEGVPSVAPGDYRSALERAGVLRWGMQRSSDLLRLIDEGAGELSGVGVECYAGFAVLSISSPAAHALAQDIANELVRQGMRGVYLKRRLRADLRKLGASELAPPEPIAGEAAPAELAVRHGELRFSVQLGDGLSTGLFIDQRSNWSRVLREAQGCSVLNLFCYTAAFSVAAAAGGARETLSIDLSARALGQARQNLARNGFADTQHRLLKQDVLAWLPKAVAAGQRFDWVILDPPSFGTRARGVLDSERDYPRLVQASLQLLAPRGRLLCVSHHKLHTHEKLARLVQKAARDVGREVKSRPLVGPWDCPTLPGVSGTKSVLVQAS
jgi:23S rRNA (cytosine1962-C5)-methyltransferase